MTPIPSESACIVEAERRSMTVPVWSPANADDYFWRVIFVRTDGLALLLVEPLLCGELRGYVCPTLQAAVQGEAFGQGYGEIEYHTLPTLLDEFARWSYGGLHVRRMDDRR